MTRTFGRSTRGTRLIERVPAGRWETTTFLGALRADGFTAPLTVDGPINGVIFLAWVEQHLAPTLSAGDVVIMDNLSSHKRSRTRELIESVGAKVSYLPPYSPDLNPIEMIFSKIKQLLRSLQCRTRTALWEAMQSVLDAVTATDAANCFVHCGYRYE